VAAKSAVPLTPCVRKFLNPYIYIYIYIYIDHSRTYSQTCAGSRGENLLFLKKKKKKPLPDKDALLIAAALVYEQKPGE
jgi:hypothetical protein